MDFIEPKRNIFSAYSLMWRRGLDFRGLVGRRSYWLALALHFAVICALFLLAFFVNNWIYIAAVGYSALSLVPFISMTARRLHDTGRSGALAPLVLVGVGLFFCMSGSACLCIPIPYAVYGPPFEDSTSTSSSSAETTPEEDFFPEENIGECVYGPPEWFGIEEKTETTPEQPNEAAETEETREETETAPAETITESEITLPSETETTEQSNEAAETEERREETEAAPSSVETALPPETEQETVPQSEDSEIEFDPAENIEECVYGPPEWFE